MTNEERLALAAATYRAKAEGRLYVVSWRGGGTSEILRGSVGFNTVTTLLGINGGTLYNYLCRGKGTYQTKALNPVTGEMDIVTINRVDPPAKERRPRGRPRKHFPSPESAYPDNTGYKRSGIILAPPARSVPKTRKRSRREKQ